MKLRGNTLRVKHPPRIKTGDTGWYPILDPVATHLHPGEVITLYRDERILAKLYLHGVAVFTPRTVPNGIWSAIWWPTTPDAGTPKEALEDEWEIYHESTDIVLLYCSVIAAARNLGR